MRAQQYSPTLRQDHRAQQAEERQTESRVAAEQSLRAGLPILQGSEKQVAWAETLRKNALAAPANTPKVGYVAKTEEELAQIAVARTARATLETKTSAKWYIDNRAGLDTYVRDCVIAASKPLHNN